MICTVAEPDRKRQSYYGEVKIVLTGTVEDVVIILNAIIKEYETEKNYGYKIAWDRWILLENSTLDRYVGCINGAPFHLCKRYCFFFCFFFFFLLCKQFFE